MADQHQGERWTLTVTEAAERLGLSRTLAYQLVRRGDLPAVRLGRRLLVPRGALDRFLAEASTVADCPRADLLNEIDRSQPSQAAVAGPRLGRRGSA
jgi:excisionase family DNA binding protein